jgi:hypothetical protein
LPLQIGAANSILDCRKHEPLAAKSRKPAPAFRAMLLLVAIARCDWRKH